MNKWADYCISAVWYDRDRRRINYVQTHLDLGNKLGMPSIWSRYSLLTNLDRGHSFVTIYEDAGGNWLLGDDVRAVEVCGRKYLRTDASEVEGDDLGGLPRLTSI